MHRHELERHVALLPLPGVLLKMRHNTLHEAVEELRLRHGIRLLDGLADGVELVD
jgi:hypothetical protein